MRADVAAALAGSAAAASPSAADRNSIQGQLLPLPPRGQLTSGPTPTAGGPPCNINKDCSNPTKEGFPSSVTAGQAELAKASAANSWAGIKWKPAVEKILLVFCCFSSSASTATSSTRRCASHFVAEIAGELSSGPAPSATQVRVTSW